MTKIEELFQESFSADILIDIIEAERLAYKASLERHDPTVGHDASSFGFINYKSKKHFLSLLHDPQRGITVVKKHPYFSMQVGSFLLSAYNAGDSSETELSQCFPRNRRRANKLTSLNTEQLRLDLEYTAPEVDDSNCRHLILCDLGDSVLGMAKIFIGVPIESDGGRISKWSRTFPIWERDVVTKVEFPAHSGPIAPVEVIQPAKITLKPKTQRGAQGT